MRRVYFGKKLFRGGGTVGRVYFGKKVFRGGGAVQWGC